MIKILITAAGKIDFFSIAAFLKKNLFIALSDRDRKYHNFDSWVIRSIILRQIVDTIVITRPHIRKLNIADTSSRNWQPSKQRAIICRENLWQKAFMHGSSPLLSRGFSSPYNNPIYIFYRSRKLRRRRCHCRVCHLQSRLLFVTINALFVINVQLYLVTYFCFIFYSLSFTSQLICLCQNNWK